MVTILVWDRYRYINTGKYSGFKKNSNSVIFSQLMRFNASNLENPYQQEQLGELLANINGVVVKIDSSGNCNL